MAYSRNSDLEGLRVVVAGSGAVAGEGEMNLENLAGSGLKSPGVNGKEFKLSPGGEEKRLSWNVT